MTVGFVAILAWLALGAPATESTVNAWTKMRKASITTSATGSTDSMTCDMEFTPQSDTRVQVSITQDGKTSKGSMMLVSGLLLTKDVPVPSGSELDMMDACGITLKLANELLGRGTAVPPMSIRGRKEFEFTEPSKALQVSTTTAETAIPAPWSVRGWVESDSAGDVAFDLVQSIPGSQEAMHLSGVWQRGMDIPELPDAISVAGWKVFKLGPRQGGGYGGTPVKGYATLGELRGANPPKQP